MDRKVDLYVYEWFNFCSGRPKISRRVDFRGVMHRRHYFKRNYWRQPHIVSPPTPSCDTLHNHKSGKCCCATPKRVTEWLECSESAQSAEDALSVKGLIRSWRSKSQKEKLNISAIILWQSRRQSLSSFHRYLERKRGRLQSTLTSTQLACTRSLWFLRGGSIEALQKMMRQARP